MLGCCTDEGSFTCQGNICKEAATRAQQQSEGGANVGSIIGGVVGGVVGGLLMAAIVVLLVLLLRQRRKRQQLKQAYSVNDVGGYARMPQVRFYAHRPCFALFMGDLSFVRQNLSHPPV